MSQPYTAAAGFNAVHVIDVLLARWQEALDRYDGRGTAASEPSERLEVGLKLETIALLLCAIPAPDWATLGRKALVAAWLRQSGTESWASAMAETALAQDHMALQETVVSAH